jgi:4-hydroxybenzoate polyprenyltransferase
MQLKRWIKNFSEMVVFEHTLFSLPFIFTAMVVAAGGWFGWGLLALGLLAAVSARNFAMGFNRLVDRRYDALNPRTASRPSVDGRLSVRAMILFVGINALLFVGVSYLINDLAFKLSLPFLVILGAYSLIKRFSALAHLFLGMALALAPIAGAVAVLGSVPIWSVVLAVGVLFWVAGFDLLYALQDREFDEKLGLHSIPVRFGVDGTFVIARLFHLIAFGAWLLFVHLAGLGWLALAGVLICGVMLVAEHKIAAQGMDHINRAFFTVNGYLGVIFFIFVVGDVLWRI